MVHIVYIIGHRSCDGFRTRNLLCTIEYLVSVRRELQHRIHLTIVVVEQDERPTLAGVLKGCHYRFLYNCGQYNRGWAFNTVAVEWRNYADYYFFADNDILIPDLANIFSKCDRYSAVSPYKDIYDTRPSLFQEKDLKYLLSPHRHRHRDLVTSLRRAG